MSKTTHFQNQSLKEIKKNILDNRYPAIECMWLTNWDDIENSSLADWHKPDKECTVLLHEANIENLISKLDLTYLPRFGTNELYNSELYDERTTNILHLWINKIPILPVTLTFKTDDVLLISDGNHSINAARYLRKKTIPFIVSMNDISNYGIEMIFSLGSIPIAI